MHSHWNTWLCKSILSSAGTSISKQRGQVWRPTQLPPAIAAIWWPICLCAYKVDSWEMRLCLALGFEMESAFVCSHIGVWTSCSALPLKTFHSKHKKFRYNIQRTTSWWGEDSEALMASVNRPCVSCWRDIKHDGWSQVQLFAVPRINGKIMVKMQTPLSASDSSATV